MKDLVKSNKIIDNQNDEATIDLVIHEVFQFTQEGNVLTISEKIKSR